MSKEFWFREYERLYNEREAGETEEAEGTDEGLANLASKNQAERQLERADIARDEE